MGLNEKCSVLLNRTGNIPKVGLGIWGPARADKWGAHTRGILKHIHAKSLIW